jgi:hypothetical protein
MSDEEIRELDEQAAPPAHRMALVVADTIVCVAAMIAFAVLTALDKDRTALYGTVLGAFTPVLIVQLHTRNDVREGQKRAAKRTKAVVDTLKQVERQVEGMPSTPDELRKFIRAETTDLVERAAVRAVQLYAEQKPPAGSALT